MAKGRPSKSIDFFISYATSDEAMAKEIGAILDEAGYSGVGPSTEERRKTVLEAIEPWMRCEE